MTAEEFRKDKYLRATGYNFYVWATANVLITWPLYAALAGRPWPGWLAVLYPIALIATGIFLSVLNDNRVQKMWGTPNPRPLVEAGSIWGPIFLIGLIFSIVLSVRGPAAYIQPLWLLLVGAAYLMWGNFGVPEFRRFGWTLVVVGGIAGLAIHPAEIPPRLASRTALSLWILFMGILWVPFGAYINRKYLYPASSSPLEMRGAADGAP